MKIFLSLAGFVMIISLPGCEPTSRLYQTPPLYFGSSHFLPMSDSNKHITASAGITAPTTMELKTQYRFDKNFFGGVSYHGNMGKYADYSNSDVADYKFKMTSFEICSGFSKNWKPEKAGLFISVGYGRGHTTSIVPENDNSQQFYYNGNFRTFTIIPGFDFITGRSSKLLFSWRQSLVKFKDYKLPDTGYYNKHQFLSDIMLSFSLKKSGFGMNLFTGGFLNGKNSASDRQFDLRPDQWKTESFIIGMNLAYDFKFHKKKK
jgi:hypothetical protein